MSTIKSSAENLTLNADGANNDVIIQSNGSTKVTVDGQNSRVGIGTASPTTQLDVTSSGNGEIAIISGTSGITSLYMGDSAQKDKGKIFYHNGSDYMAFNANGGEKLRIDATGAVTMPSQPAFLARPSSTQSDLATGGVTIAMGTEVFDNNADFSSNTFTAPVAGRYLLSSNLYMGNLDSASQYYQLEIKTSNRIYYDSIGMSGFNADVIYYTLQCTVLADMDAGDTAYTYVQIPNGTAQADVFDISYFSGYLVA